MKKYMCSTKPIEIHESIELKRANILKTRHFRLPQSAASQEIRDIILTYLFRALCLLMSTLDKK
jgi:hypothetical protein